MTSSFPVADLKGNIFRRTIYSPSLIVIASIVAKVWRGVEDSLPPPSLAQSEKKQKSPVKIGLMTIQSWKQYFFYINLQTFASDQLLSLISFVLVCLLKCFNLQFIIISFFFISQTG